MILVTFCSRSCNSYRSWIIYEECILYTYIWYDVPMYNVDIYLHVYMVVWVHEQAHVCACTLACIFSWVHICMWWIFTYTYSISVCKCVYKWAFPRQKKKKKILPKIEWKYCINQVKLLILQKTTVNHFYERRPST